MSKFVCQVKTGKTFQVINLYRDDADNSAVTCRTTILANKIVDLAYKNNIYDVVLVGDKETIENIQQQITDLEKSTYPDTESKITVGLTY